MMMYALQYTFMMPCMHNMPTDTMIYIYIYTYIYIEIYIHAIYT